MFDLCSLYEELSIQVKLPQSKEYVDIYIKYKIETQKHTRKQTQKLKRQYSKVLLLIEQIYLHG